MNPERGLFLVLLKTRAPETPAIGKYLGAAGPNVVICDADFARMIKAAQAVDDEGEWDGHLFRLVICLAVTGARFSQVARIKVSDLQLDRQQLMVPVSRKGRGRKARTAILFPLDTTAMDILRPAVAGRRGSELLLQRWAFTGERSQTWRKSNLREWLPAEITAPFRKIADRAGLSLDVTAYALRTHEHRPLLAEEYARQTCRVDARHQYGYDRTALFGPYRGRHARCRATGGGSVECF
jgi:integrase